MIVSIRHGISGWGSYVRYGTKKSPRDLDKIFTTSNIELGDSICEGGYYSVVLGFKGRVSNKKAYKIMKEWESLFMHGYEAEEYYMDYMIHQDTDDTHIHIRVADINLFTNTKLRFYYHQSDMRRKDTISRYLDKKYQLHSPDENRVVLKDNYHQFLDEWREANATEALKIKRKKDRDAFREKNHQKMIALVNSGAIQSYDNIVDFYKSTNYKVVNHGFDRNRDSYYITLEDSKRKKAKVYGAFYAPEFWKQSAKKRKSDLEKNSSECLYQPNEEKELLKKVKKLNDERKIYLDKRYAYAREKAYKKLQREALEIEWDEKELREWQSYQNLLDGDKRFIEQREEKVEKVLREDKVLGTALTKAKEELKIKQNNRCPSLIL
jgi:hypothetical protein